ncbi:MAG: calcium-binding protein [Pseudomonadota bacterium]
MAEDHFLLSDPNRTQTDQGRDIVPLDQFITFTRTAGLEYSIVVPTLHYIAAIKTNAMTMNDARAELRSFVQDLKAGAYGEAMPTLIEIGNEYYTMLGITKQQAADFYGEIAFEFAKVLTDELPETTKIAVQAGINEQTNDIILQFFEGQDARVDSVIIHSYPWTLNETGQHVSEKGSLADKWTQDGLANSVYLSEWNISGPLNTPTGVKLPEDLFEKGMAHAAALIEFAAGYLADGVEYAAVWPIQQNTPGDLSGNEGEVNGTQKKLSANNLTLVGEAFELLSGSVVGARIISTNNIDLDNIPETARYRDEILIEAFETESSVIVFASAWDMSEDQLKTEFNLDLGVAIDSAEVTVLRSAANNKTNPNGTPSRTTETFDNLSSTTDVKHRFEDSYEIVRIIYNKSEPGFLADLPNVERQGTDSNDFIIGTDRDEIITALSGSDTVMGNGGSDTIHGSQGEDEISGGADDDLITGSGGHDRISGGLGNDFLKGGTGSDRLIGDGGDDVVRGGAGADDIQAGSGDDFVVGSRGDDRISGGKGNDDIKGGSDNDHIRGGRGADDLRANGGHDTVKGGDGDDRLAGGQGEDLLIGGKGDDNLMGGGGDDILRGGVGDDVLTGGGGADRFVFDANDGASTITDFMNGQDRITFRAAESFDDLNIHVVDGDLLITSNGTSVTLSGLGGTDLSADYFMF